MSFKLFIIILISSKQAFVGLPYFIRIVFISIIVLNGWGFSPVYANAPTKLKLKQQAWILRSAGIRPHHFIDVYQCGIYLPEKSSLTISKLVQSIEAINFPIAIRIEILTSMLPDKMPEPWRETLESEITGKAFRRFQKGFAKLDKGDTLIFVYIPKEGTLLFLNGKRVFKDPGRRLMQGLLEQWIGAHAISQELKQALIKE